MSVVTEHAPALNAPTPGELALAAWGAENKHGIANIAVTVHGEIMAVCICSAIGYGSTEDEARAELDGHDQ